MAGARRKAVVETSSASPPNNDPGSPDDAKLELRHAALDAARQAFIKHGKSGARTSQIARSAGISESVLWSFFASKEEIFAEAVFDRLAEHLENAFERYAANAARTPADWHQVFVESEATGIRMMDELVPLYGVALFSDPLSGKNYYRQRLVPLFEELNRKLGPLYPKPDSDRDAWADLMISWGILYGIALRSRVSGKAVDVDRTAQLFANLLFRVFVGEHGP